MEISKAKLIDLICEVSKSINEDWKDYQLSGTVSNSFEALAYLDSSVLKTSLMPTFHTYAKAASTEEEHIFLMNSLSADLHKFVKFEDE
jgi:hypothetical protein